jgi:hypothetical protein
MNEDERKYYREYMKEYWKKNPKKYEQMKKKAIRNTPIWRKAHPEEYRRIQRRNAHKTVTKRKAEIFLLLGNQCSNPYNLNHGDFLNLQECLQIDHINGKGVAERKLYKSYPKYLKIVLESIKSGSKKYQLLCANCNWLKRAKNKEVKTSLP